MHTQGYIVGMRKLDSSFSELLAPTPQSAKTSESFIVRKQKNNVEYITPLSDGTKPLSLKFDLSTSNLVAANAVNEPGRFIQGVDYKNTPVLAASQKIARTNWLLIPCQTKRLRCVVQMNASTH